jgi:hypothetical protein
MSPLQELFASVIARDESERAIEFAQLQSIAQSAQDRRDASAMCESLLNTWRDLGKYPTNADDAVEFLMTHLDSEFGGHIDDDALYDIAFAAWEQS